MPDEKPRYDSHDDLVIALGLSVGMEPQAEEVHVVDYLNPESNFEQEMEQRDAVRRTLRGR